MHVILRWYWMPTLTVNYTDIFTKWYNNGIPNYIIDSSPILGSCFDFY